LAGWIRVLEKDQVAGLDLGGVDLVAGLAELLGRAHAARERHAGITEREIDEERAIETGLPRRIGRHQVRDALARRRRGQDPLAGASCPADLAALARISLIAGAALTTAVSIV